MPKRSRYQAYYCEENAFWLAQHYIKITASTWVCFISNPDKKCMLWAQRAVPSGTPVLWDYHVVVVVLTPQGLLVHDLDCEKAPVLPLQDYITLTFPHILDGNTDNINSKRAIAHWYAKQLHKPVEKLEPYFRLVDAVSFVASFSSDRSHMRDAGGAWRHPPPPWPPIQIEGVENNLNLFTYIQPDGQGASAQRRVGDFRGTGQVMNLKELLSFKPSPSAIRVD